MAKIITQDSARDTFSKIKDPLILAGGCFDIIHPGHVKFLQAAKELKGLLIIMLESDLTVAKLKGSGRPIHTQNDRALVLSHIDLVDYVILLNTLSSDHEYEKIITDINPAFIAVTEGDTNLEKKLMHADKVNAELKTVTELKPHFSTTKIVDKLNR